MTYEDRDETNDNIWKMVGIADLAMQECCLDGAGMQMDNAAGCLQVEVQSSEGIAVQFLFDKDGNWTGHAAVVLRMPGTESIHAVPRLDLLIDALMTVKDSSAVGNNP